MPTIQCICTTDDAMRQIFNTIDADGSGTLDKPEIAAFIKQLRPSRAMDIQLQAMDGKDEVAEIMAVMDVDGNGEVDFDEFAKWWREGGSMTRAEREEKLALTRNRFNRDVAIRKVFDDFDVDGNGTLDREEVRSACVKLGKVLTREELDAAMYEMDVDCSGTVDFAEFLAYVKSGGQLSDAINVAASLRLEAQQRANRQAEAAETMAAFEKICPNAMKDLFDEVDSDGNGSLDREEVVRFIRKLKPTKFMSGDEIATVMSEMDTDGDGVVTFEEFSAWWRAGGSVTTADRLDEQVERCGGELSAALSALEECRSLRSMATASQEAAQISEHARKVSAAPKA